MTVHVCVYTCVRVYMCACLWPYMCACIWPYMCACLRSYICAYIHVCVLMTEHVCVHMTVHMCVYTCVRAYDRTCVRVVCVHVYISTRRAVQTQPYKVFLIHAVIPYNVQYTWQYRIHCFNNHILPCSCYLNIHIYTSLFVWFYIYLISRYRYELDRGAWDTRSL